MKQEWLNLLIKINAMSARERAMIFAAASAVFVMLVVTAFLEPLLGQQKKLSSQLLQSQSEIGGLQAEIKQKMALNLIDPDIANRARVQQLKQQVDHLHTAFRNMEQDLVAPGKVATLLQSVLKQHGKLRLLSLKTLPGTGLNDLPPEGKENKVDTENAAGKALLAKITAPSAGAAPATTGPAGASAVLAALLPAPPGAANDKADKPAMPAEGPIFRHGVEVVVHGGYLELLEYMAALEALPWRLYWGKVQLNVDTYPNATLTMDVYTLSLDRKWLNL
jgi:MSHA biogenesis protein MshJ